MAKVFHPGLAAAAAVGASASFAPAGIVYNSLAANQQAAGIVVCADPDETDSRVELPGSPTAREFDAQVGDAITLAGTDRFVTNFTVRLAAYQPTASTASANLELNIYTSAGGLPGSLLWTGTSGVVFPSSLNGVDVSFTPNITVPGSLVFSVAFSAISNAGLRPMGAATASLVQTGSSGANIVVQDTATQAWRTASYGSAFENVQARIVAVPAPSTAALLTAAACAFRRRHTRGSLAIARRPQAARR